MFNGMLPGYRYSRLDRYIFNNTMGFPISKVYITFVVQEQEALKRKRSREHHAAMLVQRRRLLNEARNRGIHRNMILTSYKWVYTVRMLVISINSF